MDNKVIIGLVIAVIVIAAGIGVALTMNNNNGDSDQGVEYLANGGAQSLTQKTSIFDKSSNIPDLYYEKNNETFVGYTLSSDGTGTVYKIGDKVPDAKKLYAKYEFNTKMKVIINNLLDEVKVKYNGNEITSGQELTSPDCKFTIDIVSSNPNYTFESRPNNSVAVKNSDSLVGFITYSFESYRPSSSSSSGGDFDLTHYPIDTEQMKTMTINSSVL